MVASQACHYLTQSHTPGSSYKNSLRHHTSPSNTSAEQVHYTAYDQQSAQHMVHCDSQPVLPMHLPKVLSEKFQVSDPRHP